VLAQPIIRLFGQWRENLDFTDMDLVPIAGYVGWTQELKYICHVRMKGFKIGAMDWQSALSKNSPSCLIFH
jgi:hypothetical protein